MLRVAATHTVSESESCLKRHRVSHYWTMSGGVYPQEWFCVRSPLLQWLPSIEAIGQRLIAWSRLSAPT